MNKRKPLFEHASCTRCGGCGEYSHCERYGTTCFKCGGSGYELTARGSAAQAFYNSLLSKPAREFQVGESYRLDGKVYKITESCPDPLNPGLWKLDSEGMSYGTGPNCLVRIAPSKSVLIEAQSKALEYQATLTKRGKPRSAARRAA